MGLLGYWISNLKSQASYIESRISGLESRMILLEYRANLGQRAKYSGTITITNTNNIKPLPYHMAAYLDLHLEIDYECCG